MSLYSNVEDIPKELYKVLDNPPYDSDIQEKKKVLDTVIGILVSVKENCINEAVNRLNMDQIDVLTKYIYRGLESGSNSNQLFKWFSAVHAKAGYGCIVRVLTDSETV